MPRTDNRGARVFPYSIYEAIEFMMKCESFALLSLHDGDMLEVLGGSDFIESESPPAEPVASGSPPKGGVSIGKAPLGLS
jgi:hypothetical protein